MSTLAIDNTATKKDIINEKVYLKGLREGGDKLLAHCLDDNPSFLFSSELIEMLAKELASQLR